eukprot:scaffold3124_cov67-Cyclotella_meneghiniana.AAC.5
MNLITSIVGESDIGQFRRANQDPSCFVTHRPPAAAVILTGRLVKPLVLFPAVLDKGGFFLPPFSLDTASVWPKPRPHILLRESYCSDTKQMVTSVDQCPTLMDHYAEN